MIEIIKKLKETFGKKFVLKIYPKFIQDAYVFRVEVEGRYQEFYFTNETTDKDLDPHVDNLIRCLKDCT